MHILHVGELRGHRIAVGKVVKAHGTTGEIKVYPFSGQPQDFRGYGQLLCSEPDQGRESREYRVVESRSHGNLAILRLSGLNSREEAEALKDWELSVAAGDLPPLAPGSWYWHDLEGVPVVSDDGRELGVVSSLLTTGAHDILVVTGPGGEYLIPAIAGFVAGFVDGGRALLVTPPPGLLEMNN